MIRSPAWCGARARRWRRWSTSARSSPTTDGYGGNRGPPLMVGMEHSPPPFFKRGPAPLVRLFFFATLSLALLVIDARFRYVEGLRSWLALPAYPIQRAALLPFEVGERVAGYFSTQTRLVAENERLRGKALEYSQDAQRFQAAQAEATELRRIIDAGERLEVKAVPAECLYASRDPYAHRIFIDRGQVQGIKPGSPVTDESGVV